MKEKKTGLIDEFITKFVSILMGIIGFVLLFAYLFTGKNVFMLVFQGVPSFLLNIGFAALFLRFAWLEWHKRQKR